MNSLRVFFVTVLAIGHAVAGHIPPACTFQRLRRELAPRLSPGASIVLPNDPAFNDTAVRADSRWKPTFCAVVEVTTTEDVQEAVSTSRRELGHF